MGCYCMRQMTYWVLEAAQRVSQQRVWKLERPYRDKPFGPLIGDRVNPDELVEWVKLAGFSSWECIQLTNVELYRLGV